MAYANEGIDQRAEVLQGATDSLVYWPKVNGANVVPSAATVTISGPDGSERVASTAVTPDATTGQLARSQAWTEASYELGEDYSALWTFTVSSVVHSERQYFDVVRNK